MLNREFAKAFDKFAADAISAPPTNADRWLDPPVPRVDAGNHGYAESAGVHHPIRHGLSLGPRRLSRSLGCCRRYDAVHAPGRYRDRVCDGASGGKSKLKPLSPAPLLKSVRRRAETEPRRGRHGQRGCCAWRVKRRYHASASIIASAFCARIDGVSVAELHITVRFPSPIFQKMGLFDPVFPSNYTEYLFC